MPDGDRMMEFPDHDSGAGIAGLQGPIRKYPQGGEAPGSGLEKHPPDRQENESSQHDYDGGREVVPPDHPEVEAGGMVGHEIEDRIGPEQGEGSVEKPPSRAYQARPPRSRITGAGSPTKNRIVRQLIQPTSAATRITDQPKTVATRIGFRQFIGPAGRRPSALETGIGFCQRIEPFSGASAPPLWIFSEPSRRDK